MLVLSRTEVESVLDVPDLVEALAGAMRDLSTGAASMPPRMAAMVPDRDGMLASMPAHLPSAGALTTKLVSLFPRNREQPTHQAVICCFDPVSGSPLALMDGTAITAMRTAGLIVDAFAWIAEKIRGAGTSVSHKPTVAH